MVEGGRFGKTLDKMKKVPCKVLGSESSLHLTCSGFLVLIARTWYLK